MKRYLASALVLGSFSVFGLAACDDTQKSSSNGNNPPPVDGKTAP